MWYNIRMVYPEIPGHPHEQYSPGWSDDFLANLRSRLHGANLLALAEPKPDVAEMAHNFAGDHLPADALQVAQIAHIAELSFHHNLGLNIRRSLVETFHADLEDVTHEDWHEGTELRQLRYTFGLLRDFPTIAAFIKNHEERCRALGHEYVDIKGLVDLVEQTNFESILIKSALDYSNFLLLEGKEYLTDKEKSKMRQIITAIKSVDSPLLALTGFDAWEAEILSKAYCWELEQSGDGFFVAHANEMFHNLGGRQALGRAAETFLDDLFDSDSLQHDRVSSEQEEYGLYFSSGTLTFNGKQEAFRVLARLKSVGATAKKIKSLYNKSQILEMPMDVIGVTLIAQDEAEMELCLENVMQRLTTLDMAYQAAPSRNEQVHIKGRSGFLAKFGKDGKNSALYQNLAVQDEPCDNGYEAVKLTLMYTHNGIKIPIEIQFTHETARTESRVGLGSHTLFKLMKLAKDSGEASILGFSDTELLEKLGRISARKKKFDKYSYETNGDSTIRGNAIYKEVSSHNRQLGNIATRH